MRFDLHNSLKACAGLMVISLFVFAVLLFAPFQTWAKDNYTQSHANDPARTKAAVDEMTTNGLIAAIDSVGGSYAPQLKAIAIRESDGILNAVNDESLTACAFQVHPMHFKTYAARNGMTVEQFTSALLTSPQICAQTGADILMGHINRQGPIGGFCGYAGTAEYEIFKKTGSCPMYDDVRIYMALMDGTLKQEVNTDVKSPDFGNITISDGSGVILKDLNCQDRSKKFALALVDAHKAYLAAMHEDVDETAWLYTGSEASKPPHYSRGNIKEVYCLFPLLQYFNVLQALVGGLDALQAVIRGWALTMIDTVCTYFMKFNETLIWAELSKHCISLPDLQFGIDLGGISRKTCGGNSLSMGSILATDYGHGTLQDLMNGKMSWPAENGLPTVNGVPTTRPEAPNLFFDLRRK